MAKHDPADRFLQRMTQKQAGKTRSRTTPGTAPRISRGAPVAHYTPAPKSKVDTFMAQLTAKKPPPRQHHMSAQRAPPAHRVGRGLAGAVGSVKSRLKRRAPRRRKKKPKVVKAAVETKKTTETKGKGRTRRLDQEDFIY